MSKYTTEIRFICEQKAGLTESVGYGSVDNVITTAAPHIFNFDFPIFDEYYRLPLEKKILRHYYTREISEETVGLWQLRLEDKMNLIMPYYNKLYESELLKFNPLYDTDLHTEHTKEGNDTRNSSIYRNESAEKSGESTDDEERNIRRDETVNIADTQNTNREGTNTKTFDEQGAENGSSLTENNANRSVERSDAEHTNNTESANNNSWDLYSDTPQSGLTGVFNAGSNLANNGYLTNARNQFGGSTNVNVGETDRTGNESENTSGNESNVNNKTIGREGNETGSVNESEVSESVGNRITDIDGNDSVERKNEYSGNSETNISGTENTIIGSLEDYTQYIYGKRGGLTYSKMLKEFRETFLRIDEMLIEELSTLFFGLW